MEMEKKNKSVTLHVNINEDFLKQFDVLYPHCRRRFVENAMRSANLSRELFDRIFFMDLLNK